MEYIVILVLFLVLVYFLSKTDKPRNKKQIVIRTCCAGNEGMLELNEYLNNGWIVVSSCSGYDGNISITDYLLEKK